MARESKDFQNYFQKYAHFWSSASHNDTGGYFPIARERALKSIHTILKNSIVTGNALDVGSGPGIFAALLAENGYSVVGVDFSSEMIALARKYHPVERQMEFGRLNFELGDWEQILLQKHSESVSLITALGFIYYLENPDLFYTQASRLLSKDGLLVVSYRNKDFDRSNNFFSGQLFWILQNLHHFDNKGWLDQIDVSLKSSFAYTKDANAIPMLDLPRNTASEFSEFKNKFDLEVIEVQGIHGHLLHPAFDNDSMAKLNDTLSFPLSIIPGGELNWYSHFLVTYRKN
jgi:2-polyprenyl-3-methyl-5-hydroxy-6-metoxy-1,4-benzoquinol methylase